MKKKIFEYSKSDHFMHSQWDRKIDDQMLCRILPFIESKGREKLVSLVFPSFLKKRGIAADERCCMVVIIRNQILVTVYWSDHPNYLFKKERNTEFQILY